MNNFFKILLAGVLGTIAQRLVGVNPISLEGFILFMLVFIGVSFLYQLFFQKKEKSKKNIEESKRVNTYYFSLFKKFIFLGLFIFILNILVNFVSFSLGLFDDEFKYRFDTSKAVSLNLKDKKPIKIFELHKEFYFLYKYKEKYYLVKQKENIMKDRVLTLYSSFGSLDYIFNHIKNRKDFYDIVDNLSPTIYREVGIDEMFYKPLWFSNSIKYIYWLSHEKKRITDKSQNYLEQKKQEEIRQKQKNYKKLLNKDLKLLSLEELHNLKKDIYTYYAYTRNTKYVISIFNEIEKRDDKALDVYTMNLINYLYLYRTKVKLNDILLNKKYNMGVTYSFVFFDNYPLDIPKQKYSHLRISNLNNKTKLLLWQEKIKDIKVVNDQVQITFKDGKIRSLGKFERRIAKKIVLYLNAMTKTIYTIEKEFYKNR